MVGRMCNAECSMLFVVATPLRCADRLAMGKVNESACNSVCAGRHARQAVVLPSPTP